MELLIIIFCICIIYKTYEAKIKGYLGEKAVVAVLSGLPEGQYKILNDSYKSSSEQSKGTGRNMSKMWWTTCIKKREKWCVFGV